MLKTDFHSMLRQIRIPGRTLVLVLTAGLALAACGGKTGKTTDGASGDMTGDMTGDMAGDMAAVPKPEPPKPTPPKPTPIPKLTVSFKVTNGGKAPLYPPKFNNFLTTVRLERLDGTEWKPETLFIPPCMQACPAGGAAPSCSPMCHTEPDRPAALAPGAAFDFSWPGVEYKVRKATADCMCFDTVAAPRGKHRVRTCLYRELGCAAPPCVKDGKLAADAWGSGPEVCAEKEFELAETDLTVELAFP